MRRIIEDACGVSPPHPQSIATCGIVLSSTSADVRLPSSLVLIFHMEVIESSKPPSSYAGSILYHFIVHYLMLYFIILFACSTTGRLRALFDFHCGSLYPMEVKKNSKLTYRQIRKTKTVHSDMSLLDVRLASSSF